MSRRLHLIVEQVKVQENGFFGLARMVNALHHCNVDVGTIVTKSWRHQVRRNARHLRPRVEKYTADDRRVC